MKFTTIKKDQNSYQYRIYETNDDNTTNLNTLVGFLISDAFEATSYLNWIDFGKFDDYIGGDLMYMKYEDNKITIKFDDYLTDSNDPNKKSSNFETTKEQIKSIFIEWVKIVTKNPINNKDFLPNNILFTLDKNDDVNISVIEDQDPRFSRLIEDNKKKYTKLIKSKLFEHYIKVESNDYNLYEIGLFLSYYSIYREYVWDWINSDSSHCFYWIKYLKKDKNVIYVNSSYDSETQTSVKGYPVDKQNLIDILNQWDQILKLEKFPDLLLLTEENGQVKLTIQ